MSVQNHFAPLQRVTVYCDNCRTDFSIDVAKDKKVTSCPCCGHGKIAIERIEWLKA